MVIFAPDREIRGVCYLIALRSSTRKMNGAKMMAMMQPIKTPP